MQQAAYCCVAKMPGRCHGPDAILRILNLMSPLLAEFVSAEMPSLMVMPMLRQKCRSRKGKRHEGAESMQSC